MLKSRICANSFPLLLSGTGTRDVSAAPAPAPPRRAMPSSPFFFLAPWSPATDSSSITVPLSQRGGGRGGRGEWRGAAEFA